MPIALKRGVIILVAAFAVFYLLSEPEGAADAIQTVIGGIADAFGQLLNFFAALAE